jgi:hypothetical protein
MTKELMTYLALRAFHMQDAWYSYGMPWDDAEKEAWYAMTLQEMEMANFILSLPRTFRRLTK